MIIYKTIQDMTDITADEIQSTDETSEGEIEDITEAQQAERKAEKEKLGERKVQAMAIKGLTLLKKNLLRRGKRPSTRSSRLNRPLSGPRTGKGGNIFCTVAHNVE